MDNSVSSVRKVKLVKPNLVGTPSKEEVQWASPSAFNTKKEYEALNLLLGTSEYQGLKGSVQESGKVLMPILVDENMTVLDGHHRLKIALELGLEQIPYLMVKGLSQEEKIERVFQLNDSRRHSSPEQKQETFGKRVRNLIALHEKNPNEWPIKKIAERVGRTEETIREKMKGQGVDVPDRRTKLTKQDHEEIKKLVASKKPYEQIAADFGITKSRVSQIGKPKPRKTKAKPAIKDPGATGPFVDHWPTEKKQERAFLNRVKKACAAGQMAVAVVPNCVVEKVRDLIQPQKEQGLEESQESSEGECDSDFGQLDGVEDEGDGRTDEDRKAIAALFGDADDEEDDE